MRERAAKWKKLEKAGGGGGVLEVRVGLIEGMGEGGKGRGLSQRALGGRCGT